MTGTASFAGASHSLTVRSPAATEPWSRRPTGPRRATATMARSPGTSRSRTARWSSRCVRPRRRPCRPVTRQPASPALSTTASPGVALGAAIHDTALLSGGSSRDGHDHLQALPDERHDVLERAGHRHRGGQRRRQLRLAGGHAPERGRLPVGRDLQRRRAQQQRRHRVQRPERADDHRDAAGEGVLRALAGRPARPVRQGAHRGVGPRDGDRRQERDLLPRRPQAQDGDQVKEPALLRSRSARGAWATDATVAGRR